MPSVTTASTPNSELEALARLYERMERAYADVAGQLGLSCSGCQDNCCRSYFQHHTYIEWAFLWRGLASCRPERRERFLERAEAYVRDSRAALASGRKPRLMCPLNEDGWCGLYASRMMICRLHGVPNRVRMPDGGVREFPGCAICQELVGSRERFPALDRTPFYHELARLERAFRARSPRVLPRVSMTLAEMIVEGAPPVPAGC